MTSFLSERKATVVQPHTSEVTDEFLNSIATSDPSPQKTSKPFFVSPPSHNNQSKGKIIYDWTKDHFAGQMLEAVALDLATRFPKKLKKLAIVDIKDAIMRIGDPVQGVSISGNNIGIKMSYADNPFSVPIKEIKYMAKQNLIHLTQ